MLSKDESPLENLLSKIIDGDESSLFYRPLTGFFRGLADCMRRFGEVLSDKAFGENRLARLEATDSTTTKN